MFYALVNDQPKIMSKVNLFVALAPIARMAKTTLGTYAHGLSMLEIGLGAAKTYRVFGPNMKNDLGSIYTLGGLMEKKSNSDEKTPNRF